MATCFLDTNVCVGYLDANDTCHNVSVAIISRLVAAKLQPAISPLVLDELIYILIRNMHLVGHLTRIQRQPLLKQSVTQLLKLPHLLIINPPTNITSQLKVINLINQYSLKPRDAYHLLTIKHHHLKYFATLDHDFDLVFQKTRLKPFGQTPATA